MTTSGRKQLLCEQNPFALTGIDFVWVDPSDHRRLAVFFVIEPDDPDPLNAHPVDYSVLNRPIDQTIEEFQPAIEGLEDGSTIPIEALSWDIRFDATGAPRMTLTVLAEEEGDFQNYLLTLTDTPQDAGPPRLDAFCDKIVFSFKQPCPSPFDCKPVKDCPPLDTGDYPVDYLARDFESFRTALMAFAADRYPNWEAQVPADQGAMIAELFAALGDEFSYIQDRFLREGWLETLTQRRSFRQLARLVDFRPDPGVAATGLITARLYAEETRPAGLLADLVAVPAGARVWADQEDQPPLPFEIGENLEQMMAGDPTYPVHTHWSDLPAYVPDPDYPCLPIGAREMYLADGGLLLAPHPPAVLAGQIAEFWAGRQVLIETRPSEPEAPVRRIIVTLDEAVESFDDPLTGAGPLLRLHWREEDVLPFELDQSQAFVTANLLPVRAGLSVPEDFVVGDSADPALAGLARTIQRGGPRPAWSPTRPAIHRHTLIRTVDEGLGWREEVDDAGEHLYHPDVVLQQIDPVTADWSVGDDALAFAETDEAAAIEPGAWGALAEFDREGLRITHFDYIGGEGFTLRFGDGEFGRIPADGHLFTTTYRTGPGAAGNAPADTITRLEEPADMPIPLQTMPLEVRSVRNPLALTNGRDPQELALARRIAPAAYKALVFRAVRNEDYRAQAGRLDWVQQAGAVTRWTGAWASTFVTADPKGAFEISEVRLAELQALMGAVRQVGRCVITRQPVFLPLDLKIAICLERGFAFGDVLARVLRALSPSAGPGAFFHPDNFTFGTPLSRPSLEAAIACVEGVSAVLEIQVRIRGRTGYFTLDTPELAVADNRILKVENDPRRPGQGSIRIYEDEIPAMEAA